MFTGAAGLMLVEIPQDENSTNVHGRVAVVHEHVWRTLCSVCATGERVARRVPHVMIYSRETQEKEKE